jgi:hypothetical protein
MGSKNDMTRKEFITLTFTLIGAGAFGACSDDDNNTTGIGGTSGGTAGTFGTSGSAGSGGKAGGAGGGAGGTTGAGGAGGTGTAACTNPLPESQVADTTGHTHTVAIPAAMLDATTAQTFDTSVTDAHMHSVTLEPTQLAALKSGGSVTVMSSISLAHGHMYAIRCH